MLQHGILQLLEIPERFLTRFFLDAQLREATLILPRTGERVKKAITLRGRPKWQNQDDPADVDDNDDSVPLLGLSSSDISNGSSLTARLTRQTYEALERTKRFAASPVGKGIFKCSLTYLLGTMATFVPQIAAFLGHQDGKHITATVTVYFHPARSRGNQLEATFWAAVAFLYAAFISVTSMAVSVVFGDYLNMLAVGHMIVLVVFCGGGLGFVGWVKQKLSDPLVNVACSLTSLAIITVLTKEGAVQAGDFSFAKISQVLKMVVMGVTATSMVNFCVFPVSAKTSLRQGIIDLTDSLGEMLVSTTTTFLSGFEEGLGADTFADISKRHKKTYANVTKALKEAKWEHYVEGTEREYRLEKRLLHVIQQATHSLGGLRSAVSLQFALLEESRAAGGTTPADRPIHQDSHSGGGQLQRNLTWTSLTSALNSLDDGTLASIREAENENASPAQATTPSHTRNNEDPFLATPATMQSPADIFDRFIQDLGPAMRSLAYTLGEILAELPYGPAPNFTVTINGRFRHSLDQAIELYTTSRAETLRSLYRQKDLANRSRPLEARAGFEEVAAACGHFSASLQDFAMQLKEYLVIVDELQLEVEERPAGRTWNWLKIWKKPWLRRKTSSVEEAGGAGAEAAESPTPEDPEPEVHLPVRLESEDPPFIQSIHSRWSQYTASSVLKLKRFLREEDTRFAIKVGVGAAIFALPSFLESTRPLYSKWRGEWGLLSFMLVCSIHVGASNTTGFSRFGGTCLGAFLSILAWDLSGGNPFILAFLGWLVSLWIFYLIVGKGQGPLGRFILLTYNLSALYAYSLSVKDDDHDEDEETGNNSPKMIEIAKHRVVAVLCGCLWGLIITRMIWPISARRQLKHGLAILWLRMALIWKRDPLSSFLETSTRPTYMDLKEEFELQRFLARLEKLRVASRAELELGGDFQDEKYGELLRHSSKMLDAFHAMNVEILKDLQASDGEVNLLKYTNDQRSELASRLSHLFSGEWSKFVDETLLGANRYNSPRVIHETRIPSERRLAKY